MDGRKALDRLMRGGVITTGITGGSGSGLAGGGPGLNILRNQFLPPGWEGMFGGGSVTTAASGGAEGGFMPAGSEGGIMPGGIGGGIMPGGAAGGIMPGGAGG